MSDLYDDIESQAARAHSRLERVLLLSLAAVLAYSALAYFVLPAFWTHHEHQKGLAMPDGTEAHFFWPSSTGWEGRGARRRANAVSTPQCPLNTSVLNGSTSACSRRIKACTSASASTTWRAMPFIVLVFGSEIASWLFE